MWKPSEEAGQGGQNNKRERLTWITRTGQLTRRILSIFCTDQIQNLQYPTNKR